MAEKETVKEPSSNDDSDEVDDPDEIPEISSDESDLEEPETQSSASKKNSVTKSKAIFIIKFPGFLSFFTLFVIMAHKKVRYLTEIVMNKQNLSFFM